MKIVKFETPEFGVIRTQLNEQNEPMFCLKDVCNALELQVNKVKERLNAKGMELYSTPTNGGLQDATFINESNLYRCVMQSRKSNAVSFQDWIVEDVLPSIRKNGGYIMHQETLTPEQIVANALVVAQKIINDKDKALQQSYTDNKQLMNRIEQDTPKVQGYDTMISTLGLNSLDDTSQLISDRGLIIGRNTLINKLKCWGMFKQNKPLPKQTYINLGLFETKSVTINGNSVPTAFVTNEGVDAIWKRLIREKAKHLSLI